MMDLRSPNGIHEQFLRGVTTMEIATLLGIPAPQVYIILHKHRTRLVYLRTRLAKRAAARNTRINRGKDGKSRLIKYAGQR